MKGYDDKDRIELWLRAYNRLENETYVVESWPDDDSSKKNIDALCRNAAGKTLAIEHTLIEPFPGNRADIDRFLKTLGALEEHPLLKQPGYMIIATQPVGAIPNGIKWNELPQLMITQLAALLPDLSEGSHAVPVVGPGWSLDLHVNKRRTAAQGPGSFSTGRIAPGDPGPKLILTALEKKIPKLAAATADKKILLLEKDAVSGNVEEQFGQLPDDPQARALLESIDEIWTLDTAPLESEGVVFANLVYPALYDNSKFCSLTLATDVFWRVVR
jgi:hypothetical protein